MESAPTSPRESARDDYRAARRASKDKEELKERMIVLGISKDDF